jgi:hypothetical protein
LSRHIRNGERLPHDHLALFHRQPHCHRASGLCHTMQEIFHIEDRRILQGIGKTCCCTLGFCMSTHQGHFHSCQQRNRIEVHRLRMFLHFDIANCSSAYLWQLSWCNQGGIVLIVSSFLVVRSLDRLSNKMHAPIPSYKCHILTAGNDELVGTTVLCSTCSREVK